MTRSSASFDERKALSVVSSVAAAVAYVSSPPKVSIFLTLDGSLSSSVARRSPWLMIEPAKRAWLTFYKASVALMVISIFIASASANGSPAATSAPSSHR